jgi:hypothetical protein
VTLIIDEEEHHVHLLCTNRINQVYCDLLFLLTSLLCFQSKCRVRNEDRGGDNVLLGRSYRTPHGAVIDEYGALVKLYWQGKTEELGEKPAPVPFFPPHIPHGSTQVQTWASVVTNRLSHGMA